MFCEATAQIYCTILTIIVKLFEFNRQAHSLRKQVRNHIVSPRSFIASNNVENNEQPAPRDRSAGAAQQEEYIKEFVFELKNGYTFCAASVTCRSLAAGENQGRTFAIDPIH